MQIVHHPGAPLKAAATAAAGTVLHVRLEPEPGFSWSAVASSDPHLAALQASNVDASGTATATIALREPGTATLTATISYAPDPHGPPTRFWRLTLTITPPQAP